MNSSPFSFSLFSKNKYFGEQKKKAKQLLRCFFLLLDFLLMSSSDHRRRSSSTHSQTSAHAQTHAIVPAVRSMSVPNRQFIIILTNNSDILRRTRRFRPQVQNYSFFYDISFRHILYHFFVDGISTNTIHNVEFCSINFPFNNE